MKNIFLAFLLLSVNFAQGQEKSGADQFWNELLKHCGKAFEGKLAPHVTNDSFSGQTLIMFVRSCEDGTITIPLYVGEDKSRTWVLTLENDRIKLKHDHRHEDGSEDAVTQYGGTNPNSGSKNLQFFPADSETADLIGYAATNVWWIGIDEFTFSYNLKRIGTDNPAFQMLFDLTKPVEAPGAQWGWD